MAFCILYFDIWFEQTGSPELRALPPGLTREDALVVAEEELLVELLLRELDDGLVQQSLVVVEIREIDDRRAACLHGHGRWVGIARYLP